MKTATRSFNASVSMPCVVFSYVWRTLLMLIALTVLMIWVVSPYSTTAAILIGVLLGGVIIAECVRRILRCRASFLFEDHVLTVMGYCGSSFRLDRLTKEDFLLVQNPAERRADTGRMLIRRQGIYLRGIRSFAALKAYIDENYT